MSETSITLSESLPELLRRTRAVEVIERSLTQNRLGHGILLHGDTPYTLMNLTRLLVHVYTRVRVYAYALIRVYSYTRILGCACSLIFVYSYTATLLFRIVV